MIVETLDEASNRIGLMTVIGDPSTFKWTDIVAAKGFSIVHSTNDRFTTLKEGQVVEFRNIFECKQQNDWHKGYFHEHSLSETRGQVKICVGSPNANAFVTISTNDVRTFKL